MLGFSLWSSTQVLLGPQASSVCGANNVPMEEKSLDMLVVREILHESLGLGIHFSE